MSISKNRLVFLIVFGALFVLTLKSVNGQNIVRQSVHLGGGSSHFATDSPFNGCGVLVNAGWQKTLKNTQLRLAPELTAGFYNNNCTEDTYRADYSSLTIRGIINFDFLQSRNFAAFIGTGPAVNYSFGDIIGSRGIAPGDPRLELIPRTETQFHIGMAANVGLRFLPKNGRIGFEMIPVNVQFDFSDYAELIFQARFFYSLDARRNPKTLTR